MKSILKATALFGSTTFVNALVALAAAKTYALTIGVEGVGRMGLLLGVMNLAVIFLGFGANQGLVREGAKLWSDGEFEKLARLEVSTRRVLLSFAVLGSVVMVLAHAPIAAALLHGSSSRTEVALVAAATSFLLFSQHEIALLNACSRLRTIAILSIVQAIVAPVAVVSMVLAKGIDGIAGGLALANGAMLLASYIAVRRDETTRRVVAIASRLDREMVRGLLSFGGPYTLSTLAGSGSSHALPILLVGPLGEAGLGSFRAAWSLSANYIALFTTALSRDFYPRVARSTGDPAGISRAVNDQIRIVTILIAPIIVVLHGTAPWVIQLLYSAEFLPGVAVLLWLLPADLLKLTNWAFAYAILAAASSRALLVVQISGGVLLLSSVGVGTSLGGLQGAGIGFFVAMALQCGVAGSVLAHSTGYRPSLPAIEATGTGLVAIGIVGFAEQFGTLAGLGTAGALGLLLGLRALRMVLQVMREPDEDLIEPPTSGEDP